MLFVAKSQIWTEVQDLRARVDRLLLLPGWTQKRLGIESDVPLSTLNSWRRKGRGLLRENFDKLKATADRILPPEPETSSGGSALDGTDAHTLQLEGIGDRRFFLPVVDLDMFRFTGEADAMDARLEEDALFFLPVPGASKKRNFLVKSPRLIRLRRGTIFPGQMVMVDKKREPKKGRAALIAINGRGHLADLEEDEGQIVPRLENGDRPTAYMLIGVVKYHIDMWD